MIKSFKEIIRAAEASGPKRLITAFQETDLDLLCRAAVAGLIVPILVGDAEKIEKAIGKSPLASLKHDIIDERDPSGILPRMVSFIQEGRADILMQGCIDQKAFLDSVLDARSGLLKTKTPSYVSVFQLPKNDRLILVSDTFLIDYPGLVEKQRILENALTLSSVLGIESPRVAVLAAIEQVNPAIPSTLDAAILSKMSQRGQWGKAIVEGPLDIDCALSCIAARRKRIETPVSGNADIYIVPEIDTGYLLAEILVCLGKIPTAGMVVGTTSPVLLNVPFIPDDGRMVEIAMASLVLRGGEDG